jgi:GntR family transcriptional repressor for pyruvate dehydrogenase complex
MAAIAQTAESGRQESGQEGNVSIAGPLSARPQQIADRLVTAIALGEYIEGQRLPTERELAALLKVSRLTVREAMHTLEADGFIDIKRGRAGGAFVAAGWQRTAAPNIARTLIPSWNELEDVFDLRKVVEPVVARKAVDRHDQDDLRRIREAVQAYRAATDRSAMSEADNAVHAAIAHATKNPSLAALSQQFRMQARLGLPSAPWSPEIHKKAILDHDLFLQAFIDRNADDAAKVAAEHVDLTANAFMELRSQIRAHSEPGPR